MKTLKNIPVFLFLQLLYSCAATNNFDPQKKYSVPELQQDYTLLRNILEEKHPSLYWYTPRDSMDMYFNKYYSDIKDSMTEQQFGWKVVAPLTDKIHCGHTSFGRSRAYNKWAEGKKTPSFPLLVRCWNDTMAVTGNLNRNDTIFKRGTIITSINGIKNAALIKNIFGYMTEDGYANNVNYNRLSNNFPYYHRNIFGISKTYAVTYLDKSGTEQRVFIAAYGLDTDSVKKARDSTVTIRPPKQKKQTWQEQLKQTRSLVVDTANNTAIVTINSFSGGSLRKFYRQTFGYIKRTGIDNVVLDIRSNGGGRIRLSTLLTKYVTRVNFKVADTAYAITKSLRPYSKYIKGGFIDNLGLFFLTKKKKDGVYHFRHWERRVNKPKAVNNYTGNLYVLIAGNTFSAASLFSNAVKGQPGVVLLGEETGGGWHGNNGILIPDIVLPNTHINVRLPLFRLVQYKHAAKDGRGIPPDIHIGTNYNALVKGFDYKMKFVMDMIKARQQAIGNR
jgi:predicted alpha/beta-fold hydrolase